MERQQFTFYRSYFRAIKLLPKKEREPVFMAICAYALDGEEPKLSDTAAAVFELVRPTLDTAARKAENGKRGGSKAEAKRKQTESKTEANGKQEQTASEKENEIEKENEKELEIEKESYKDNIYDVVEKAIEKKTDAELGETFTAYMDKMNLSSTAAGELKNYYEDFGKDICIHVRNIAIDAAALNWSYCRAVFQSYKQNKYTTLEQITAAEAQRTARKAQERHNRELSKHGPSCTGYEFDTGDLDRLTAQIGGKGNA